MAPTETLAEQHFLTVESLCTQLGVTCGLLTSSVGKRDREQAAQAAVVVGTHALIQAGVDLGDLAVAVVDEQHRFGVEQRKALSAGTRPHMLHMTATPIPRTLALTVYGDLAVSEIAELPAGRQPDHHQLGDGRAQLGSLPAPTPTSRGRQAGLRRLSARLGVRSHRGTGGGAGGRAAAARRAARAAGRLHARPAAACRAPRADGALQGGSAGRARRDHGDRGRRRRAQRDDHDRAGSRPLRPGPAPPAPRPRGAWGGAVVLPARVATQGGADGDGDRPPGGARGHVRRLPAGRGRPRPARRRRAARQAPVRPHRLPVRPSRRRSTAAGARAGRGGRRSPTTTGR